MGVDTPGPGVATLRESRRKTPSAPASKRATSPAQNCGPIATARLLISSCTPLAKPKYTRMGATPAMVFTLLALPLPANTRRPAASCTSTQESAEKLKRSRARPIPAMASGFGDGAACAPAGVAAAPSRGAKGADDANDGADVGAGANVADDDAEVSTAAAESV